MDRPPLLASELADAFERVQENEGCAGVDGVTVERFASNAPRNCTELCQQVANSSYRALPLLRIIIEKGLGRTGTRTLLVPAVRDRVLQSAVARRLSRSYEEEFLDSSYAYRPGRGVDRAIARVRMLRDLGYWHVVDADIRGFFDSVDFATLESHLAAAREPTWILDLVSQWIRAPAWDGRRLRHRTKGLPQGSPISPLLANFYLTPLDLALSTRDNKLVRYADDFLVLAQTAFNAEQALELIRKELARLRLNLNAEKTRLTSFDLGVRFLGALFTKDEIWIPWKNQPKAQGRIVHFAQRMPEPRLQKYRTSLTETPLTRGLRNAGLRYIPSKTSLKPGDRPVAYLYLTEQGAILRKSGDRFLVEHDDRIVLDIPYHKLEHVLIFGNVQVTSQAVGELLEKGVDLTFLSWQGRLRGSISPLRSTNIRERLAQYDLWRDQVRSFQTARTLVVNKVHNALATIDWLATRRGQLTELSNTRQQLSNFADEARSADSLDAVRGYEGASARAYFGALADINTSSFKWAGRHMNPAPDPINALLSLTYTLLTQELGSLLEADGLEPALGCLHELDGNRPSLALDLVEAFRHPVADRFVLSLLERNVFEGADFVKRRSGGVVLTAPGLRRFLESYERWMLSPRHTGTAGGPVFREILRREARRFVLFLRGDAPFQPYRFGPVDPEKPTPDDKEEPPECDISSVTI